MHVFLNFAGNDPSENRRKPNRVLINVAVKRPPIFVSRGIKCDKARKFSAHSTGSNPINNLTGANFYMEL